MSILFISLTSCSDNNDVYIADRQFVRIDQPSVYLTVGEKIKVTATVDDIAGESYDLQWSVLDPTVATAEKVDDKAVAITAQTAGKTVIKVENSDGSLKYFADLSVSDGNKPVKILSIGSGMANDATSNYLYDIAENAGDLLVIGNMYVEGASLEYHVGNLCDNKSVYNYNRVAMDGSQSIQTSQTLKSIIKSENWDYIVYEESMPLAGKVEGYKKSLPELIALIDKIATNPDVKYLLHQPWAYASKADEDGFAGYDRDQLKMYNAIVEAVGTASQSSDVTGIIPTGTTIQNGRTSYIGEKMLMDGFHLNPDAAKFAAACTWYASIFGRTDIAYNPANLISYDTRLAKHAASTAIEANNKVTAMVDYADSPTRVYIDFGPIVSPAPFNNYRFPGDPALTNMTDDKGKATTWGIAVNKPFTGTLERGLENSLGFPRTASEDMFFSDGIHIPLSGFEITGLNPHEKYSFSFYGHINDNGTQTVYKAIGKNSGQAMLVNDYNADRVAAIKGIEPDKNGTITIEMSFGPDNVQFAKFFGINVMVIMAEG